MRAHSGANSAKRFPFVRLSGAALTRAKVRQRPLPDLPYLLEAQSCKRPRGALCRADQLPQRRQPQLHPQPADVPPTLPQLKQPQPQPVDVPPTLPQLEQPQPVDVPLHLQPQEHGVEPLTVPPEQAVQSKQKQHLRLVLLLAPLTEPFDLQQGLQQDWQTKLGKVMPPQRQELHIRTYLQKRCHGTRIP